MVSIYYCLPFAGMLLSIALFPIFKPDWWEKHQGLVVAAWCLAFIVPYAVGYTPAGAAEEVTRVMMDDYIPFIVLLFGLFCITGNISMESNVDGSPRVNLLFLLVGTLLASWIGTTGASMVMIRPVIRANRWRKRKAHTMVFFIFLVSNIGGVLTPVGDPPLLMGFMRNIPFFWSLRMIPLLALNVAALLGIYYFVEKHAFTKDLAEGLHPDHIYAEKTVRIRGGHNVLFLLLAIIGIILRGALASHPVLGSMYTLCGDVKMTGVTILEMVMILIAVVLSFLTTDRDVRIKNDFSWGPIKEVAVLFIGIFITMIPALMILRTKGAELGLTSPAQMFWATGVMSSFLDNTPTYLVFLTTAGTLGAKAGIETSVGMISQKMLMAISGGAVFMGANTYIGNAPNFMVKSIAEESGIRMPSFFGYMKWSLCCLIPVFLLDTAVFFL